MSLKVLYVSQEITPYLPESEISVISRYLPQGVQEQGREIRTFMTKYGCINERRNQLHEVIRLSGMNMVINDTDHPLIIKVASIQPARMQVYFIDNEDYFGRKFAMRDKKGSFFADNDERAIFYARGVIETVKKLCWAPDLVHCHGWFSALVPLYIRKTYADDPLFSDLKIIYSVYNEDFKKELSADFSQKIMSEGISKEDVAVVEEANYVNLNKLAIEYSNGVIMGSKNIHEDLHEYISNSGKPVLEYQGPDDYIYAYNKFYDLITRK